MQCESALYYCNNHKQKNLERQRDVNILQNCPTFIKYGFVEWCRCCKGEKIKKDNRFLFTRYAYIYTRNVHNVYTKIHV